MKITVGTTNQIKVAALVEVLKDYHQFKEAVVDSVSAPSGVSDQPLSLAEMIQGAKTRAKNAFSLSPCHYGVGLESGLFEAPGTQTGFLEGCICCFHDGENDFIGLSSGFEVPPQILDLVVNQNFNLNDACFEAGVTDNQNLGQSEGLIGILTMGRLTRKSYTMQSIVTALAQVEHLHLFAKQPNMIPSN